jgi:hypothetical protein
LIKLYRNTIEDLFDCFDFTICQFAWDGNDIFSTIEGVITTERKHLSVHKVQKGFEIDSLRRAFKYFEKGYKPCLGTIGELGKSLAGTELKEIEQQIQISPGGNKRIVRWD